MIKEIVNHIQHCKDDKGSYWSKGSFLESSLKGVNDRNLFF